MCATCCRTCTGLELSGMLSHDSRGILSHDSKQSKPKRLIGIQAIMQYIAWFQHFSINILN